MVVAAGFERAEVAKFFETPFAVVEVGEGGGGGGEQMTQPAQTTLQTHET